IAAREHGAHLVVAEALEHLAQLGHLDGHAAHVDAPQQDDVSHPHTLRPPSGPHPAPSLLRFRRYVMRAPGTLRRNRNSRGWGMAKARLRERNRAFGGTQWS